ncbi:Iron-dependent repressor IdeR [Jeotgalibaca dankookensis]|uniref:Manganese transport regulator n=1 Tax=Jeotgalibaca dankookensis TaxID=708126 RepID=A0A1S6IN55_9LACT|nr:metal-dependent transcriptional regulator [Jeotgalibaca dankookensis]AQS52979.1 Iron-dependent repressor IdeR [Jeotgalibaca dankookensis]
MTPQKEDYLKTIIKLGGNTKLISNKLIGQALSVSAASVTEMSAKLLKEGYIIHVPYRGVKLSEKGIAYANQMIRKHRLWEVFLSKHLGFNWDEVHDLAETLEHVSPDILIERLDAFLDYPTQDPHGGLIPDGEGNISETSFKSMSDIKEGDSFKIVEVADDSDFLKKLTDKKILMGKVYQIVQNKQSAEYIYFSDESGERYQISFTTAEKIRVQELA